ncbi:MAG TPA: hypothetical protein VFY29_12395 [Terriglobia bacterium]|nr:hypothetical protein [Terriglobia bacterium]
MAKLHSLRSWLALAMLIVNAAGCKGSPAPQAEHEEAETLARTEFTDRIENFFEYEALKAGQPSQFRIHLTDLSDGFPVEKAEVTLTARSEGKPPVETLARVGKVTGIYVADLALPSAGAYEIEFHIRNAKVDERLHLRGFEVE